MVLVYWMADSCLYNKQNNTWVLGDMEFIFSCSHSISHSFAALTRLISIWTLEDKFHISAHPCIILYVKLVASEFKLLQKWYGMLLHLHEHSTYYINFLYLQLKCNIQLNCNTVAFQKMARYAFAFAWVQYLLHQLLVPPIEVQHTTELQYSSISNQLAS